MATFYLDFEGGNDSNDGTTFANRWKSLQSGALPARIAPGDTIRVMGSPAPTSLGVTGVWTDGPLASTKSISSSTNATPIVMAVTAHGYSTGDCVLVNGHTTNTNANGVWDITVTDADHFSLQNAAGTNSVGNGVGAASGTVRLVNNGRVKLASAVTQNVACVGNQGTKTNWTASANVTCTVLTTTYREGGECQQVDIAAGFTTGLAAYVATGTLNLAGYQQISFSFRQSAGTRIAAGDIKLKLCSDAAGATPVNSFDVPATGASTTRWIPVTVDLATNLGASIQSIALYVNTDSGAQTFQLDNIIACKASSSADSLTLGSLIGKNSGTEPWLGVMSINGTRLMLDQIATSTPATPPRGYSGVTETVTTYKRECVVPSPTTIALNTVQDSGTAVSPITFSGGWDRTAMTTQNLETVLDAVRGGASITIAQDWVNFDKIGVVRSFGNGFDLTGARFCGLGTVPTANHCANTGISFATSSGGKADVVSSCALNGVSGISSITGAFDVTINRVYNCFGNADAGVSFGGAGRSLIKAIDSKNNATFGLDNAGPWNVVKNAVTAGNATSSVRVGAQDFVLRNGTFSEATFRTRSGIAPTRADGMTISEKHNATVDDHRIYLDDGAILSTASVRHSASGIAWNFQPTTINRGSSWPMTLSLGKIVCASGTLVTVNIWTRRDNTNIQGQLLVKGYQIAGVDSDVTVACAPSINTWTQSSALTFTPTEAGVVEVFFQVWDGVGTSNNFYIDDLTVA